MTVACMTSKESDEKSLPEKDTKSANFLRHVTSIENNTVSNQSIQTSNIKTVCLYNIASSKYSKQLTNFFKISFIKIVLIGIFSS